MPGVEFEHVDLSADDSDAVVRDLDLSVAGGELLVVLGDQAAAVVRAARGDGSVRVDRGIVRIGSQVVNEVPFGERDVATVPGNEAFDPGLTVWESLAYPLILRGVDPLEADDRVDRAVTALDLSVLLNRRLRELTPAQRRRVAMAGAVLGRPRALLEVGATPAQAHGLADTLSRVRAALAGLVPAALVSVTTAAGLDPGTLAAVLDAGRLVQRGLVGALRAAPASLAVASAVADGPLISVPGTVEGGRLRVGGLSLDVPGLLPAAGAVDVVLSATSVLAGGGTPGPGLTVLGGVLRDGPNRGVRLLDAGGPGERVAVVLDPRHAQVFSADTGHSWLARALESTPVAVPAGGTYVNVGFADAADAGRVVEPETLAPGERLWLWVELGPRLREAVPGATEAVDPEVLRGLDAVDVVLFPDGPLTVTPDPATGRLAVRPPGPFPVVRPAAVPPVAGALAARRLFFGLTAPAGPGAYRVRCAVYAKGLLLHVEQLTVVVGGSTRRIAARTTFRLTRDLAAVDQRTINAQRLSVYANAGPGGSHDFSFHGADGGAPYTRHVHIDDSTLGAVLRIARGALHQAAWGTTAEYAGQSSRYDTYPWSGFAPALAGADLIELARSGHHLWTTFAGLPDESPPGVAPAAAGLREQLRDLMRAPGGAVQLAPIRDPDRIMPLQLLYDRVLDAAGTGLALCTAGDAWIASGGASELPCLTGCSEPDDPERVCPAGFWGMRHLVSITPAPEDVCRKGLPPRVPLTGPLRGLAGFTTDPAVLAAAGGHVGRIQTLLGADRVAYTREALEQALASGPAQVLYLLCHVTHHDTLPRLVVGPVDGPGIDYTTLVGLWAKFTLCAGNPLVVLNACDSAAPSPERLLSLVRGFLERGAAGAVGTETTVFVTFAVAFAEHLLRSYVDGVALGEAIRRARVAMLGRGNPLGLTYLAFGLPELAVVPGEAP